MKFYLSFIIALISLNTLNAQFLGLDLGINSNQEIKSQSTINFDNGDFEITDTIQLKDTEMYTVQLKTDLEKKYYLWLRKRVRDVWPYVRTAVLEYNTVTDTLSTIEKRRLQKKFIKSRQNELGAQFEDQLKKMSISRGQIITKLIHKETGKTTYDIIKELRGGISAFLYQTAGGAYEINLKQTFDPKKTREDLYIYIILQRDIAAGILQPLYD